MDAFDPQQAATNAGETDVATMMALFKELGLSEKQVSIAREIATATLRAATTAAALMEFTGECKFREGMFLAKAGVAAALKILETSRITDDLSSALEDPDARI